MKTTILARTGLGSLLAMAVALHAATSVTFNRNFEGGSLGKIQRLADTHFRCSVEGQQDEHGRNRQANWYYFSMGGVKDCDVTLTLTDFVGEYNGRPGACPMNADTIPVFSYDDEHWQHFRAMDWDEPKKEATLRFRGEQERIWIAHVPPYTHTRLLRLLAQIGAKPVARVEVIGRTVQGRDLHLVTVTNFERPDGDKKTVWLQARQHAWETGTSEVMEGALRFITSEDAGAAALRDKVVFKFTPMVDPDGCANGGVRFNANGYDLNRHWDEVDLRQKAFLERMPEIWYVKKAILGCLVSGPGIDLMVNLHNEETGEHLDTQVSEEPAKGRLQRFSDALAADTSFDPTQPLRVEERPDSTANWLWNERRIPVVLLEQRIGTSAKLGRRATVEDRLAFGRQLVSQMGAVVSP